VYRIQFLIRKVRGYRFVDALGAYGDASLRTQLSQQA
jgi:hypothetical protein